MSALKPGETVALVDDDTPEWLEYGDYRGWVVLVGENFEWDRDVSDAEVEVADIKWEPFDSHPYTMTGTVREA